MFGRSAKPAFLLFILFLPALSHARTHNFGTKSPFGLGFRAGLERRPHSDFIVDPQTSDGAYSRFYSFEPFLDFGNFAVRGSVALHNHPTLSGSGSDTAGSFSESSGAHSVAYGVQLMLIPYYSEAFNQRLYILAGASQVSTSLKNTRSYSSGASNIERLSGSGQEMRFGAGYEFYFVQSYSVQIEAGYRTLTISKFGYKEGKDLSGKPRSEGETAVFSQTGLVKKFHEDSPYLSLALNLNF